MSFEDQKSTNIELNSKIESASSDLARVMTEVEKIVVGGEKINESILIALMCRGHVLLEGLPGLAKTTSIKAMGRALDLDFSRVQFTPDLLPADLLGTQIYDPAKASFSTKKGPIFTQLLLADEINRAPAKVQSALLEAMGEKQITLGDHSYKLEEPFMVLATQNPIEQEGTYVLPEAQVDRFLFKVNVDYCTLEQEIEIVRRNVQSESIEINKVLNRDRIVEIAGLVSKVFVSDQLRDYIVRLVFATRRAGGDNNNSNKVHYIQTGASPRASIYLELAARAHALLKGRAFVLPQDVKDIGEAVLAHRIHLSYEAEAEGITQSQVVKELFQSVDVP